MSASFSTEIFVEAPVDRVFSTLTTLEGTPNWMHGLIEISKLTEGPFRVGTEWRETRLLFGEKVTEVFEVVGLEEPAVLQLRCDASRGSRGGEGEYVLSYQLRPEGEGTLVSLRGVLRKQGLVKGFMSRFEIGTFRKAAEKDLVTFKRFVETGRRVSGVFVAMT